MWLLERLLKSLVDEDVVVKEIVEIFDI